MRIPCIAANWKMFKTVQEAIVYAKELRSLARDLDGLEVVLAPPFTALHAVADAVRNTNIGVAGQNLYWGTEGAYTGEVSGPMLREAGAEYVIIGHSERRALFGETDATVNKKIEAALESDLVPIMCIGESLEEREHGDTLAVLDRQLREGLDGMTTPAVNSLIVAYEPVWAIGTGRNATPAQAGQAHAHIRQRLCERFGEVVGTACRIIYGGSVKPENIAELAVQPDVDGALVGGASLNAGSFFEILTKSQRPTV